MSENVCKFSYKCIYEPIKNEPKILETVKLLLYMTTKQVKLNIKEHISYEMTKTYPVQWVNSGP